MMPPTNKLIFSRIDCNSFLPPAEMSVRAHHLRFETIRGANLHKTSLWIETGVFRKLNNYASEGCITCRHVEQEMLDFHRMV